MLASEALTAVISPLVPHSSIGLWFASAFIGTSLLLCGFFSPRNRYPRPVIFYPLHFLSYHTYSYFGALVTHDAPPPPLFCTDVSSAAVVCPLPLLLTWIPLSAGFSVPLFCLAPAGAVHNEFMNSGGWGCPCSRMPGGCINSAPQGDDSRRGQQKRRAPARSNHGRPPPFASAELSASKSASGGRVPPSFLLRMILEPPLSFSYHSDVVTAFWKLVDRAPSPPPGTGAFEPQYGFAGQGNVCQMAHKDIIHYYDVPTGWNKWCGAVTGRAEQS